MKISTEQKEAIKRMSIVEYLASKGIQPERIVKDEYYYSSIGVCEHTPSFRVNVRLNRYQDYSGNNSATGVKGDIINLVKALEQCGLVEACERLMKQDFKTVEIAEPIDKKPVSEIICVKGLINRNLLDYLESRAINYSLANRYCREVHYINNGNTYYSLGFKNDLGGWELRGKPTERNPKGFKGKLGVNCYTTVKGYDHTSFINVFEGFFSFLSALKSFRIEQFRNDSVILNSVVNLDSFLQNKVDANRAVINLNLFLDNDPTGRKKVLQLENNGYLIHDYSHYYDGFKDFNDLLTNKPLEA